MRRVFYWTAAAALVIAAGQAGPGAAPQTKPRITKVIGVLVDLGCAARGLAHRGSWVHSGDDHVTESGETITGCATACLRRGQPAALLDRRKEQIVAIFACAPGPTLSRFAARVVDVQGYWAGKGGSTAFVPLKIRERGASSWTDVDCAEMHP